MLLMTGVARCVGHGTGTTEVGTQHGDAIWRYPGPRLADHLADLDNNLYGRLPMPKGEGLG
jgi:hypothetical protein